VGNRPQRKKNLWLFIKKGNLLKEACDISRLGLCNRSACIYFFFTALSVDGEIYATISKQLKPQGSTGKVYKLVFVPLKTHKN
jgi:hypothetical protein